MRKFLDVVDSLLRKIIVVTMSVMLVAIFIQVVSRYVFHHSLGFSEELARYLFVWTVFLGFPVVSKMGGHMVVGVFTGRMKGRSLFLFNLSALVCSIFFMGLLVVYGIQMIAMMTFQTSPALGITMSWVYLAIPLGSGIMILNLCIDLMDLLKKNKTDALTD